MMTLKAFHTYRLEPEFRPSNCKLLVSPSRNFGRILKVLLIVLLMVEVGPSYLSEDLCPPEPVYYVLSSGTTPGTATAGLAYSNMTS